MPTNRYLPLLGVAALFPCLALAQAPAPGLPAGTGPAPAPKAEEPPTEAENLLDEAIKKVTAIRSVSADVSQDVDMLGQKFRLDGQYLKGPDHRLYFRLTLSGLGDSKGTMLQVCDGTTMWDFQQVLNSKRYTRFDIQPVLQQLESPDVDEDIREKIVTSLGFSGPDALLIGLRAAVRFDQRDEEEFQGKKVWVIRGSWKDREGLFGPGQQPLPPTAPLPAYIPSLAVVRVGQEDGWPYQVELIGKAPTVMQDAPRIDPATGRPIGRAPATAAVEPSEVVITYSNVKIDAEIPPENFAFQAEPGAPVQDTTQELVRQLQTAAQMSAAQKKQAAQQADAPGLPGLPGGFGAPAAPSAPAPGQP